VKQHLGPDIHKAHVSQVSLWSSSSLVRGKAHHTLVVEVHQVYCWRTSSSVYWERNPVCTPKLLHNMNQTVASWSNWKT